MTLDRALEIIQASKMPEYTTWTPSERMVDEALRVVNAANREYYDANPDAHHYGPRA